jgi:hypothetical protein
VARRDICAGIRRSLRSAQAHPEDALAAVSRFGR